MSNRHDEIKNLIKASRNMLSSKNSLHETDEIKKQYGILNEQQMQSMTLSPRNPIKKMNIGQSIQNKISSDETENPSKIWKKLRNNDEYETAETNPEPEDDKNQEYTVSGGIIVLHGKNKRDITLTTDEKIAFQETMEEFVNEVSDLVEFYPLNVYTTNVVWSGKIIDFDLEFMLAIGEDGGIYVDSNMTKISEDFENIIKKLKAYYQKFKSKWAKIIGNRKQTQPKD